MRDSLALIGVALNQLSRGNRKPLRNMVVTEGLVVAVEADYARAIACSHARCSIRAPLP